MSFFYNNHGDNMRLYLDLIFFLNTAFDFLLLITVSYLLHRNVKFIRLILGSLFGGLTIFFLFINLNSFELFIYKFLVSIIMILITFSYKNLRYTLKNIFYLYLTSIVLGGFLYFLNTQFSYKQVGLVFYYKGLSINFIFLIVFSPIILYLYVKQIKWLKENRNYYHTLKIHFDDLVITGTCFLDTGNNVVDPYLNRSVIILDKRKFIYDLNRFKMILVPITTANRSSMIKCLVPSKVEVDDKEAKNVLIGLLDEEIKIDGVDAIISLKVMEGLC